MRSLATLALLVVTGCGTTAAGEGPSLEVPKPLSVAQACGEVQTAMTSNFDSPPFSADAYSSFAEEVQTIRGEAGRAAQPVLTAVIDVAQRGAFATVIAARGEDAEVILAETVRDVDRACTRAGAPLDN